MKKSYHVKAVWDPDAGVFYAETDIPGLHIEAPTMKAFVEAVEELAPQIIEANDSHGGRNHDQHAKHATLKSAAMELCYA
jgi:hypothetical protein